MFDDQGSPTRSADRLGATADLRPTILPGSTSIDRVFPAAPAAWPQFAKAAQKRGMSVEQATVQRSSPEVHAKRICRDQQDDYVHKHAGIQSCTKERPQGGPRKLYRMTLFFLLSFQPCAEMTCSRSSRKTLGTRLKQSSPEQMPSIFRQMLARTSGSSNYLTRDPLDGKLCPSLASNASVGGWIALLPE